MSLTNDPTDPRLGHGSNDEPTEQNDAYLVLSDEERAAIEALASASVASPREHLFTS